MLTRLKALIAAPETKASRAATLIAMQGGGRARWTPRDYAALAREGYQTNAIVHRCVRLIAENAASCTHLIFEGARELEAHPLSLLLSRPNARQDGGALFEALYAHLLLAGNAYVEAVTLDDEVRELYALRPDRMKVVPGADGWAEAYDYTVSGRTVRFDQHAQRVPPILHLSFFHPTDDHYGLAPVEAAAVAVDAAIQVAVQDANRSAPPSSPAEGQRHIVAASPTGAWAGHALTIATWQDGAWAFLAPHVGWCAWSIADDGLLVYDGAAWRDARGLALDDLLHLGVNTTASSPNLLSVRSNAALFAALNIADGGSGDVRVQLSKESAVKTASIYFSDAYSGRAEFGLVGSDAFKLKVSPDGSSWVEALSIDPNSGLATLPRGVALSGGLAPPQITANQNDYAPSGLSAASIVQIASDAPRSITGMAGGAAGRVTAVLNVGSQPITLSDESASSSATNRFALGGAITLTPKQSALLRYDSTAGRWHALARPPTATRGAISGLTLSTAGSSTSFAVAAGAASDGAAIDTITLASSLSKTTSAWSAGNGNGALDSGSIAASTWYHVHLIKRGDTGTVDALLSLSATAPTLPANYTLARRIGALRTDASANWTAFVQDGNRFTWGVPAVDYPYGAVVNPGTAAILRALSVPSGISVLAHFHARSNTSTSGTAVATIFTDPSQPDTAPDFNNSQQIGNATLSPFSNLSIRTDNSCQIRARLNFSDSLVNFILITDGWTDLRGS